MNILQKITLPFTIIGAFNWGLVALFNFNLVEWITRGFNIYAKIIYLKRCGLAPKPMSMQGIGDCLLSA